MKHSTPDAQSPLFCSSFKYIKDVIIVRKEINLTWKISKHNKIEKKDSHELNLGSIFLMREIIE